MTSYIQNLRRQTGKTNVSSFVRVSLVVALSLCGQFVGGPVLAALILSSLLIANLIARYYGTSFGICCGIVFTLSVIFFEFMVLVPMIRMFGPTRGLFFDETLIDPFVARDTTFQHLVELNRTGAVLIAVIPIFLSLVIASRYKTDAQKRVSDPVITVIAFLPLLIGALHKLRDPISYVVSTASGDGRNNFLHVQRIRVTSGFTNFNNFTSQGDLGSSLASLVSDGLGSTGLFRFDDQYSLAAMYLLFGVLIAASAISVAQSLSSSVEVDKPFSGAEWAYAPLVVIAVLSTQMPWVMNEMFRSGFFSAIAAMAICAVMVVACVAKAPFIIRAGLLVAVSILTFATYQVAALYPLLALALISLPGVWKLLRSRPIQVVMVFTGVVLIASQVLPRVVDRLRSRLLLEGSITYLADSIWIPVAIAGVSMLLIRGRMRSVGLVIFLVGIGTSGFQVLARKLREDDGLVGYGYYGVKFAYVGLFILLLTLISGLCALVLSGISHRSLGTDHSPPTHRLLRILSTAGLILLSGSLSKVVLPESRSLYGNSNNWTDPTSYGLNLAVTYWDHPKVVFAMVAGPGSGRLTNFWHPYFWSGDPWNWVYFQASDDVGVICSFIEGKNILVVTTDHVFAKSLEQTCGATVEIP